MKKTLLYMLSAVMLGGCMTSTSRQSSGTVVGMQLGTVLGTAVGGSVSRNYESRLWGTAIGALTGAAVGNVINAPENKQQSYSSDTKVSKKAKKSKAKRAQIEENIASKTSNLRIGNVVFQSETGDKTIAAGEYAKLTFDIVNAGNTVIAEVLPLVQCNDANVEFSEMTPIRNLASGEGIRYSVSLYLANSLKGKHESLNIYLSENGSDYRLVSKAIIIGK